MAVPDDFRDKLLHVLTVANLSRTSLAKLAKVDKSVASRWVSGATRPTLTNLDVLTKVLQKFLPCLRISHWELPHAEFRRVVRLESYDDAEVAIIEASTLWIAERMNSRRPTIAIRPFRDLGRTTENRIFCDGLTKALITALARLPGLQVIGKRSIFSFKSKSINTGDVAAQMSARYIVEGQGQVADGHARITVQLIDIFEGFTIWADHFDTGIDNIFHVQDEIVRNISSRIDTKIIIQQANALTLQRPDDLQRVERIRAAMALTYGNDASSYWTAKRLLDPILQENPDHALALRTSAVIDWHEAMLGLAPNPTAKFAAALKKSQLSIELDPYDEYAYWICALSLMTARRFDEAVAHMHRALEISPNCSLAIGSMGTILAWAGHPDESIDYTNLALARDPQNPANFFRHNSLGLAHYLRGDLAAAHSGFSKTLSRRPKWPVPNLVLAAIEVRLGRPQVAGDIIAKTLTEPPFLSKQLQAVLPFKNNKDFELLKYDLRALIEIPA